MTVITSNVNQSFFNFNGEEKEIAPGVVVFENSSSAAVLDLGNTGVMLLNLGSIMNAGGGEGVQFIEGASGEIINEAHASIAGRDGIFVDSPGVSMLNFGSLFGTGTDADDGGIYFGADSAGDLCDNRGFIYGNGSGVVDYSNHGGNVIDNSGTIEGKINGIEISTDFGKVTTIVNTGTITGGTASIDVFAYYNVGGIDLTNSGRLVGDVRLHSLDADSIVNRGTISGDVHLGGGADHFNGKGGSSGAILGEAGADTLIGGNAGDRLNGGGDKDTLTGGKGADTFDFDHTADSMVGDQRDVIADFSHAQHDRIDLSTIDANAGITGNQSFAFNGTAGFTGAGQISYVLQDRAGTANDRTMIYGNVDGNHTPEFQIEVKGLVHFVAADFVL